MTNCWSLRWPELAILLSLASISLVSAADPPLVLELCVECENTRLRQQILVAERTPFYAVTRSQGVRWTVSGRVGRIANSVLPVVLRVEVEDQDGNRLASVAPDARQLTLGEFAGPCQNGRQLIALGIWVHRGIDESEALLRAIARRDGNFNAAVRDLAECRTADAKVVVAELSKLLGKTSLDDGCDASASIRVYVAEALGRFGREAASRKADLIAATNDVNPHVRLGAAIALWGIDTHASAMTTIIKLLRCKDPYVRYCAARAVERNGSQDADAVNAVVPLTELLDDDDHYVRLAAARALLAIGERGAPEKCLLDLCEKAPDATLRRLARHVLDRHAVGLMPEPLPSSASKSGATCGFSSHAPPR